jgi:formylglycine-generating enzyme required for sulfatase activity
MEPTIRDTLDGLIRRYGHSLTEDPARCEAMLNDQLSGQHKREVFVLASALKAGIAEELLLGKTQPVSSYSPNPWGLYDMPGNVSEWVADYFERVGHRLYESLDRR